MTTHPGAQYLAELEASAKKATPGEWDVWREPCADKYAAIAELTEQVLSTDKFAGAVFLLNANGKCPAETGCGPTSEANAAHIANASPTRIAAIVDHLASEKARADAAEAERDELRIDLAVVEHSRDTWKASSANWWNRAEKAEATIASLTEQLAMVKSDLKAIASGRLLNEEWPTAYYRVSTAVKATLSRLEKQEGEA